MVSSETTPLPITLQENQGNITLQLKHIAYYKRCTANVWKLRHKYVIDPSAHILLFVSFLDVTTVGNDTAETNGGLVSFKQWVTKDVLFLL